MARSVAYVGALALAAVVASEGAPVSSTGLRRQDQQARNVRAAVTGARRRLWWCFWNCGDDDDDKDSNDWWWGGDNDENDDDFDLFGSDDGGNDGVGGGDDSSSDSIEPSTTDDDISVPYDDDGITDDDDGGGGGGGGTVDDDDGGGGNTEITCSDYNGIASYDKNTCCMEPCGACGNNWCATIGGEGYGADACCASVIADSGVICGPNQDAPCNLTPVAPGPTPTTPTPQPATTPTTQPGMTPAPQLAPAPTPAAPTTVPSPNYPFPTPAPTPVMTIPSSCPAGNVPSIRWAAGTSLGGRMYIEGEGCATMTDLYKERVQSNGWTAKGPIYVLDAETNDIILTPNAFTGKWLITSDLYVTGGGIFYCIGTDAGGDCDELRIQSTGPTDFHQIRGHGGSLYFKSTLVTSWDTPNKKPQEVHEGGRSFLNCVSEKESDVTCVGQPKNEMGECRMDILDSEIGWLGWMDSESYGITWKVRGFCVDKSNPEVFDTTNVYGDIINSDIHHLYYGMYSYGLQGSVMTNNIMRDNWQYGFDPHDDSDYLIIADNDVYNNVNHGIIASKRCNHVNIYNNEVHDGGALAAGIFLHRSSNRAKVYGNTVYNMQDAGLAILESFDSQIYDNTFRNVKYGIRISLGGGNNAVYDNTFDKCSKYGLYTYEGSDAPEKTPDGRPGENVFKNNKILNTPTGVKIKRADNTKIIDNVFTGTELLEFNDAQATTWADNTIPDGVCLKNISGIDDEGLTVPESTFTSATNGVPDPSNC